MTFLKFAAIYVSPVPLFLFYLPSLTFFLPRHPLPAFLSFPAPLLPSALSSLLHLLAFRPRISLARFISPPRRHPVRRTSTRLNVSRRRRWRSQGKEIFLSFSVPRRIVLLFAVGLHGSSELRRACGTVPGARASFSKLKTGLSASTYGPTTDSMGELALAQSCVQPRDGDAFSTLFGATLCGFWASASKCQNRVSRLPVPFSQSPFVLSRVTRENSETTLRV